MATERHSAALDVLRIVRDAGSGGVTVWDIVDRLRERSERAWYWDAYFPHLIWGFEPNEPSSPMVAILGELAELGLIRSSDRPEESSGFKRWEIGASWQPPGGDGGGRGDDAPGGGGGEGGGGGGLRETLSHPVLFALAREDFEAVLASQFEGGGA